MSASIVAFGAWSGLGRGPAAVAGSDEGEPARVATKVDPELERAGLSRPFCARVDGLYGTRDRAAEVLAGAMMDCATQLDAEMPGWRGRRIGLALGTSSGGMRGAERLFSVLHDEGRPSAEIAREAAYFSPMVTVVRESGLSFSPHVLVLTACAASTLAIGLGMRWLEAGRCDLVLAGGFDAVSVFVASGFEALRATTSRLPSRPFCVDRDGMALGEGAAVLALVGSRSRALAHVTGFGASGDAVHVTAPDRNGDGLARAAKNALIESGAKEVTLVSAHGTATPFNDAAESKAIASALGEGASAAVVHPFKAQIGHTLGAAGALETLACVDALTRDLLPAAVVGEHRDPEAPANLLPSAKKSSVKAALKLSAAFGGANAALVLEKGPGLSIARRRAGVYATRATHVTHAAPLAELAAMTGQAQDRLAKACELSRLALTAVAALRERVGSLEGAGVVVGHAYATLDVNDQYSERILTRGARFVEPRKFPYTSPNASAGECSVAFKLTGPNLAVGAGLHGGLEALTVACDLVAAGDAERIVVVAVDAPGRAADALARAADWPLPPAGAVALLVTREALPGSLLVRSTETGSSCDRPAAAAGHLALLPLCQNEPALILESVSPTGAYARVTLG